MVKKKPKKKKINKERVFPFQKYSKGMYITVKCPLKSVLRNYEESFDVINKLVLESQEIVERTYLFIRLYILHKFHNKQEIPEVTQEFVRYCICVGGIRDNRGGEFKNRELLAELSQFYDSEFKPLIQKEKYNLIDRSQLVSFLATQIRTALINNIKEHWLTRVRRLMNILIPGQLKEKTKENKKSWMNLKNAILNDNPESIEDENLKSWAYWFHMEYLPDEYEEKYGYDAKINPNKYIALTLKMNDEIEKLNETRNERERFKLFQPLSLRTSIIPGYITMDANIICHVFNQDRKTIITREISDNKDEIWNSIFIMNKRPMKMTGYKVNSIQTDGVGISILFQKEGTKRKQQDNDEEKEEIYIDDITHPEELEELQKRKLVSVDPNKQSIVQMLDLDGKSLRYTTPQRRIESFSKRHQRVILKERQTFKIENKTVQEWETSLSEQNSKTVNYEKFKKYIQSKTILNDKLRIFYNQEKFRKMKLRTWIYRRRSEDKFFNKVEHTYGKRDEIFIGYGNWSNTKQMKHIMPTKGVGFRRLMRKRFDLALVDEFRTSKIHYETEQELINEKDDENKKLHRVLKVEIDMDSSSENKKSIYVNRDINACKNILHLLNSWIFYQVRPEIYCRPPMKNGNSQSSAVSNGRTMSVVSSTFKDIQNPIENNSFPFLELTACG